jgi:predicted Zn-dependent peptidase
MVEGVEFHRKVLDNGLTVICEGRKSSVVAVASSVKFGAQYESEEIKGISHFIEHLVFKGTKKRRVEEIPAAIESKGGVINAFTAEEVTCFWNKMPKKHFALGADISRDLVTGPLFEKKALERERRVVLEEIKMYHDNPGSHVLEKIKELLYKGPFNMSIAGTHESVSGLSRERIIRLFNDVYAANNMVFSVVGEVKWEDVLREARKFPNVNRKINDVKIGLSNGESIEKRKGIDQAHEVIGFHMPKLGDRNRYAAELFDSILGGGMSSRLFQEVREKRGLCYAVKSNLEQSKDYGYEVVYVGTTKDKVGEVRKLVLKEVKGMGSLKESDLREAKERLIGLREINKEKADSTMIELLQEEIGGNAENYYNYDEKISEVKLSDVRELSKLKGSSFAALVPG